MAAVPYVITIEATGSIEDTASLSAITGPPTKMGARSVALQAVATLRSVGHAITGVSIDQHETLVPKK